MESQTRITDLLDEAPREPRADCSNGAGGGARASVGYWLYWGHIFGLFGIALSNLLLGAAVLVAPWRRSTGLTRPRSQPLLLATGAYVLLLLLSIAASFDPRNSVREATEIFTLFTLVLALMVVRTDRQVQLLVDAVLLLAVVESAIGLVQLLEIGGVDLSQRIHGSLSHYMTFSGVLMMGDLVLLSRISSRSVGAWRWLALLPINAALFGSLTRTAWVGLAAGLSLVLVRGRRRLVVAAIALVAVLFLLLPHDRMVSRVVSIFDPSDPTNYDRLCMIDAGIRMFAERPVLGQGPRMVKKRYPIYRHPTAVRSEVPHLHNSFVQLAAERGLFALASYLALMALSFRRASSLFHREGGVEGPRAHLHLAVMAVVLAFNVAGLFENNWGDTELQRLLLLFLALPFALEDLEDDTAR